MRNDRKSIEERQARILQAVRKRGEVKAEELAQLCGVSLMTVRRDLTALDREHLLARTHGGAVSMEYAHQKLSRDDWVSYCRECISRYAARFLENDETIFINGSRTALDVLKFAGDKRLTVYTNNCAAIGMQLPENVSLRLTGGEVRNHVMVGEYVMRNLLVLQADRTMMGCAAVYDDGEFRYDIPTEIGINELLLSRTRKSVYILADHTKFQKREKKGRAYGSVSYDSPVILITDDHADGEILERLEKNGTKVLIVPTG